MTRKKKKKNKSHQRPYAVRNLLLKEYIWRDEIRDCEEYPNFQLKFHAHSINLLKPTGYVMHHQFNIQQLYALPTLYLCVLYLPENKQRLVPLTA